MVGAVTAVRVKHRVQKPEEIFGLQWINAEKEIPDEKNL